MTAKTKTKRDRAVGRHHRHTAIQTIIDNHDQVRADIDSLDNSIASLQDETCNLGSRLDAWYDRLNQADENNRASNVYTLQRVVENERKLTETECAVGILQGTGKNQGKALAQLDRYIQKLHAKQTNLNHNITITRIDLEAMEKKFITLAWINLGIWVAAALTLFFLLLIVS